MHKAIFLDQNHWISLGRAFYNKQTNSEDIKVLNLLQQNVEAGKIILPLQISHFTELHRCRNEQRIDNLAVVYEKLSANWFFAAWSSIIPNEIFRAIASTFGLSGELNCPPIFGQGVFFALSNAAKIELQNNPDILLGLDLHDSLLKQRGALRSLLTFENSEGRRRQREADRIRREEYKLACEASRKNSASLEEARRIYAVQYFFEHQREIIASLFAIGKKMQDFCDLGAKTMSDFYDGIPSLDVDRTLAIRRDRDLNRKIDQNDLHDIGYLALAIPYCDAVVVENFWGEQIRASKLDRKYGTKTFTKIANLIPYLEAL